MQCCSIPSRCRTRRRHRHLHRPGHGGGCPVSRGRSEHRGRHVGIRGPERERDRFRRVPDGDGNGNVELVPRAVGHHNSGKTKEGPSGPSFRFVLEHPAACGEDLAISPRPIVIRPESTGSTRSRGRFWINARGSRSPPLSTPHCGVRAAIAGTGTSARGRRGLRQVDVHRAAAGRRARSRRSVIVVDVIGSSGSLLPHPGVDREVGGADAPAPDTDDRGVTPEPRRKAVVVTEYRPGGSRLDTSPSHSS